MEVQNNLVFGPVPEHTPSVRKRHFTHSLADKEAILKDMRDNQLSPKETISKYKIMNLTFKRDWTRTMEKADESGKYDGLDGHTKKKKLKKNHTGAVQKYVEESNAIRAYIVKFQGMTFVLC
jgi:hypothetical protein